MPKFPEGTTKILELTQKQFTRVSKRLLFPGSFLSALLYVSFVNKHNQYMLMTFEKFTENRYASETTSAGKSPSTNLPFSLTENSRHLTNAVLLCEPRSPSMSETDKPI